MDIETAKVWLQAINLIGTFAVGVWLYLEKRSDRTNERVTELSETVDKVDKAVIGLTSACANCTVDDVSARIGHVENDVAALKANNEKAPNHGDLAKVYDSINKLAATVNQLVGENRGQSDTLRLILNQIAQKGMA